MLPLNKLPNFCKCSTVKCMFQDSRFLTESFEKLVADNQIPMEASTLEGKFFNDKFQAMKANFDLVTATNQRNHSHIEEQKVTIQK